MCDDRDDAALERELVALWGRRGRLSSTEWKRLFRLVDGCLRPVRLSLYGSLLRLHPNAGLDHLKAGLIADFFADKVCRPALAAGFNERPLAHCGALVTFYKRFLLDRIKQANTRAGNEQPLQDQAGIADVGPDAALGADESVPVDRSLGAEGSADGLMSRSPGQTQSADLDDRSVLEQAAARFLDAIAVQEPWVLLYLACHFCPDDDAQVPLSRLAKRHGVKSYHHKAQRLGITWARGGFGSPDAFAATMIGQWVQGLGIAVALSELERIHAALKILCLVALSRVGTHDCC